MKTKREILAWAERHDIQVEQEKCFPSHHIHIYAPRGKWFASHGIHNLCVWDSHLKPNWVYIGKDLLDGGELEPCPLDDCEVCCDD